jgi:LPS sulfotransferase NodH
MPATAYIVCATQRSGSTLLCRLLSETGVAGNPQEYFEAVAGTGRPPHPGDFLGGLPATGLGIRDDVRPPRAPDYSSLEGLPDYRAHLRRTLADGTTPNGVFGAKIMFNQLAEVEQLAGALPEYDGLAGAPLLEALTGAPAPLRWVWVRRRDTTRQAISMWKALQTRSWRGDESFEDRTPAYRYEAIDHLRQRFEADEAGWEEFFVRHGLAPLIIGYEDDLETDRRRTIATVLEHLGLGAAAELTQPDPLPRQADGLSERWAQAYHRDRARRGQFASVPDGTPRR